MDDQPMRDMDKNKDTSIKESPRRAGDMTAAAPPAPTMTDRNRGSEERGDAGGTASATMEQAKAMARNVGEQARSMATNAGTMAQDLARRAREQTGVTTDTLYEQGTRAGEYLTRNVNEYPLAALLVAGAIGYGLGYLIHSSWNIGQWSWSGEDRSERPARRNRRD